MNIIFTTINKKICTTNFQKKLWDGAEQIAKNKILQKLKKAGSYFKDLTINITIDMAKGIPFVDKKTLTEEQFYSVQRALKQKL